MLTFVCSPKLFRCLLEELESLPLQGHKVSYLSLKCGSFFWEYIFQFDDWSAMVNNIYFPLLWFHCNNFAIRFFSFNFKISMTETKLIAKSHLLCGSTLDIQRSLFLYHFTHAKFLIFTMRWLSKLKSSTILFILMSLVGLMWYFSQLSLGHGWINPHEYYMCKI